MPETEKIKNDYGNKWIKSLNEMYDNLNLKADSMSDVEIERVIKSLESNYIGEIHLGILGTMKKTVASTSEFRSKIEKGKEKFNERYRVFSIILESFKQDILNRTKNNEDIQKYWLEKLYSNENFKIENPKDFEIYDSKNSNSIRRQVVSEKIFRFCIMRNIVPAKDAGIKEKDPSGGMIDKLIKEEIYDKVFRLDIDNSVIVKANFVNDIGVYSKRVKEVNKENIFNIFSNNYNRIMNSFYHIFGESLQIIGNESLGGSSKVKEYFLQTYIPVLKTQDFDIFMKVWRSVKKSESFCKEVMDLMEYFPEVKIKNILSKTKEPKYENLPLEIEKTLKEYQLRKDKIDKLGEIYIKLKNGDTITVKDFGISSGNDIKKDNRPYAKKIYSDICDEKLNIKNFEDNVKGYAQELLKERNKEKLELLEKEVETIKDTMGSFDSFINTWKEYIEKNEKETVDIFSSKILEAIKPLRAEAEEFTKLAKEIDEINEKIFILDKKFGSEFKDSCTKAINYIKKGLDVDFDELENLI